MEFTPNQKYSLLSKMGYTGPVDNSQMENFIASNPGAAAKMGKFQRALTKGFQTGGLVPGSDITSATSVQKNKYLEAMDKLAEAEQKNEGVEAAQQEFTKAKQDLDVAQAKQAATAPSAREVTSGILQDPTSAVTQVQPAQMVATPEQLLEEGTGEVTAPTPQGQVSTAGPAALAETPVATPAATMEAAKVTPQVTEELTGLEAAQGEVSPEAQVTAAQQTESSVSELEAAQGEAILMDNPVQREIQEGELISGSAVDAQKVEKMNSQLQAAQATPSEKATVQGQLEELMQDFEGGATPPWAAGAMRNAQAMLAQRGIGASSMAGQAVIQAAMESALPIAQVDASTRAQFESQNLSNRQQVAMFAAEQRAKFLELDFNQEFQSRVQNAARIADIANMNFTAEQQIALENSRIANTMNLQNLSNRQAMVIAEASALANLDMANLNNRQQAAVQNAQAFLQMDMANLDNEQQTSIFKTQQRVNALLSDQAAENAAEQFNAASENQTNQFFADLASTTSRFNADQKNAISQFNAGQENAMEQFNTSIEEQREQFNANNRLIIAQANAKWRQDISTVNTAAENEALMEAAKTANAFTNAALDQIWQRERDLMNFAFTQAENKLDRDLSILLGDKELAGVNAQIAAENDRMAGAGIAAIGSTLLEGVFSFF